MARLLSAQEKIELISLTHKDLSVSNISKLFGTTAQKIDGKLVRIPPKFKTTDLVHLEAKEYINLTAIDTTVGSILWNKLFIEGTVEDAMPNHFINEEITGKVFGKVKGYIEAALLKNVISIDQLISFLKNYEFYSMKLVTIFSPSYTKALYQTPPSIRKKKKEAFAAAKDKTDLNALVKIEDEVVDFAKKELNNDPGMTLFKSGARGSFDNDYKNMNLMVGPVKNESNGEYDFIPNSYLDGLKKEDWVAAGNIIVNATYPKAVGTAEGGYLTKQFFAVYQTIMTDPKIDDCGTKHWLEYVLKPDMVHDMEYQYVRLKSTDQWELLTPDNTQKYVNHHIQMRSPMYCGSDTICRKCMGDLPMKLGIKNIGLTTGRISNTLLAKKMKLFHNAKVKFDEVNIDDLLS